MSTPEPKPADPTDNDAPDVPTANPAYSTPPPEGISEADDADRPQT